MKGSMTDLPFIVVLVFIIGISLMIAYSLNAELQTIDIFMNNSVANETIMSAQQAYETFDASMLFLIIALGISSAITAYFVKTHPVFFVASFIVWLISFVIAAMFSNVFAEIASSAPLLSASGILETTVLVATHFPHIIALFGAVIALALYGKRRSGDDQPNF